MTVVAIHIIAGAGLGFLAGAFAPSLGRKIKSLWVKETQEVKKAIYSDYDKASNAVKSETEKIVSKL
jgi:hypothetical protein